MAEAICRIGKMGDDESVYVSYDASAVVQLQEHHVPDLPRRKASPTPTPTPSCVDNSGGIICLHDGPCAGCSNPEVIGARTHPSRTCLVAALSPDGKRVNTCGWTL